MKEYILYAKARKVMIGEAFGSMFLLGLSGMILLPQLMRKWSYDKPMELLYIILGVASLCGGILLFYLLLWKRIPKRRAFLRSAVIPVGIAYLLVQLLLSCMMGGIGWAIAKTGIMNQSQTKQLIYFLSGFCQNVVRAGFIYVIVNYSEIYDLIKTNREDAHTFAKEEVFIGKRAVAGLFIICAIMTLPALLPGKDLQGCVTLLGQCIFITGLMLYFGNHAHRRVINEKTT